jgi:hypothetical protein
MTATYVVPWYLSNRLDQGAKEQFDFIYINGNPLRADMPTSLAVVLCGVYALIACDDYLWRRHRELTPDGETLPRRLCCVLPRKSADYSAAVLSPVPSQNVRPNVITSSIAAPSLSPVRTQPV